MNIEEFKRYLSERAELIDREIEKFVSEDEIIENLHDGMVYSLGLDTPGRRTRGKRVRPVLALMTCESLGEDYKKAIPFAISAELLHNFLLVHDDLEDRDEVRRNRPAVWKKFGVEHAINIGDYLFVKAYRAILKSQEVGVEGEKVIRLVDLLTKTVDRTGIGQAMDISARKSGDVTVDQYMRTVTEKTGYYLAYPIIGGAIISGASDEILGLLENFGKYAGPVFQIADDILDLTEGKGRGEIGCDIKEGKRSLLVALATSECSADEKRQLFDILDKDREETTRNDISWVISLFDKYHIVDKARAKAREMLGAAKASIEDVPGKLRENLAAAAEFFLERRI
ncbi:MAG: polyprenyl synthetase family protein [Thermoplasmata archaeon]